MSGRGRRRASRGRTGAAALGACLGLLLLSGCGARAVREAPRPVRTIRVAFVGQEIWFIAPDRRWRLEGVKKREVVWSPDGRRLAYARAPGGTSARWRIYIRDEAGEPVNEFRAYADGPPRGLEFRSDGRLAYELELAPGHPAGQRSPKHERPRVLVEHDTSTGEIVAVKRGKDFVWSPDHGKVAFVKPGHASDGVHIDDALIYPRGPHRVRVVSRPAWSPDGRSLAFLVTAVEPVRKRGARGKRAAAAATPQTSKRTTLVVVLEPDNESGDLTWDMPPRKNPDEPLQVFWAGSSRVVVGPEQFKPRFSASWQRHQ